ncbi:hypothetical protein D3C87_1840660 [compost metagenome]
MPSESVTRSIACGWQYTPLLATVAYASAIAIGETAFVPMIELRLVIDTSSPFACVTPMRVATPLMSQRSSFSAIAKKPVFSESFVKRMGVPM